MENFIVIRKMFDEESKFIHRINDFNVVTFGFKIVSPFDLNDPNSVDTIDKAIQIWMKLNRLLCAKIFIKKDQQYLECTREHISSDVDYYFYDATKLSERKYHLVEYFKLNQATQDCFKKYDHQLEQDLLRVLLERECARKFDFSVNSSDLLWRLVFVQLDGCNQFLIFSANHTIIDGRSAYNSVIDLMRIIENVDSYGELESIEPYEMLASREEIFADELKNEKEIAYDFKYPAMPQFKEYPNARSSYPEDESLITEVGIESIKSREESIHISMKELIEIAKSNPAKYEYFTIDPPQLAKLLILCKKNNAKMNSLLSILLSLASRRILIEETIDGDSKHSNIIELNCVGLRRFISASNRCYHSKSLCFLLSIFLKEFDSQTLDELFDVNGHSLNREKFWQFVTNYNNELHQDLSEHKHLFKYKWPDVDEKAANKLRMTFGLSSFGEMPSSYSSDAKIKIKSFILANDTEPDSKSDLYFACSPTIDDKLHMSITYNCNLICAEVMRKLCSIFNGLTSQLLS